MSNSSDKEIVLQAMREYGLRKAQELQTASASMDGTQLYAQEDWIPDFQAAKAEMNMLERHAGMTDGFVCKSSAGRVVRLIQNYDSDIYTEEPEDLPAQWGFVWSTDSFKALPFVAISTSPYNTGDCASEGGMVYRSKIGNNVWSPSAYPDGWELVGPVGGPFDQEAGDETTTPGGTEPAEPSPDPAPDPGGDDGETQTYEDWKQPTGAHDAYSEGDTVMYNGTAYRSKINGNVWSPEAYPDAWEVVTT